MKETEKEAIEWLYIHSKAEPYEGMFEGSQTSYFYCHGCDGEFISRWPRWETPTLKTFPHKKDCKYVSMLKVLSLNPLVEKDL